MTTDYERGYSAGYFAGRRRRERHESAILKRLANDETVRRLQAAIKHQADDRAAETLERQLCAA